MIRLKAPLHGSAFHLFLPQSDGEPVRNQLAFRLRDLECYVNLIPLNPVEEIPLDEPTEEEVNAFAAILRKQGIEVAVRRRRGADIDAACGQLKLKTDL